jgi:hypothetical protein
MSRFWKLGLLDVFGNVVLFKFIAKDGNLKLVVNPIWVSRARRECGM